MTIRTYRQPTTTLHWCAVQEAERSDRKYWAQEEGLNKPQARLLTDGLIRLVPIEGREAECHLELTAAGVDLLEPDLLQEVIDDGNVNKRAHGAKPLDITAERVLDFYRAR